MTGTLPMRLWAKVRVDKETGCWLWTGSLDADGYGKVHWQGRWWQIHRLAHHLAYGPLADGYDLHHAAPGCSRRCVNPSHVVPLTRSVHSTHHARLRAEARLREGR